MFLFRLFEHGPRANYHIIEIFPAWNSSFNGTAHWCREIPFGKFRLVLDFLLRIKVFSNMTLFCMRLRKNFSDQKKE